MDNIDYTLIATNKYCHQHTFCAIARKVQNSRLSFARNCTLAENTPFRSSQQTQSAGTLPVTLKSDTLLKNENRFFRYNLKLNHFIFRKKRRSRKTQRVGTTNKTI